MFLPKSVSFSCVNSDYSLVEVQFPPPSTMPVIPCLVFCKTIFITFIYLGGLSLWLLSRVKNPTYLESQRKRDKKKYFFVCQYLALVLLHW